MTQISAYGSGSVCTMETSVFPIACFGFSQKVIHGIKKKELKADISPNACQSTTQGFFHTGNHLF